MQRSILISILLAVFLIVFPFSSPAYSTTAQDIQTRFGIEDRKIAGSDNIFSVIQAVINFFLGLLGVVAVIFVMISGWQWMTAESEEKVKDARKRLVNSLIGLIVIFAAYGIVYVVFYTINVSFMGATT